MRRRLMLVLVVLMVASVFAGAPAFATVGEGQVTVVHGIPEVAVDVFVDGDLILEDFEFGTVTDPILLAAGSYGIDIYLAGDGEPQHGGDRQPILSASLSLIDGDNVSVVAHLDADGVPVVTAFANDLGEIAAGEARLVVRHAAAAPAVDIVADGSLKLLENVTNPMEGQVDVAAGVYGVTINAAGTDTVVFDAGDVTLPEGRSTIVYAVGDLAGCTVGLLPQTAGCTFGLLVQTIELPAAEPPAVMDWFDDDNGNVHEANINLIASLGITTGTGDGTFSPGESTTRGQMAAFLRRALELPSSTTDYFTDDDNSIFEDDINAIAAAGITAGTGNGTYSPDEEVTRGQMAAFLQRAFDIAPSGVDAFTDDDNSIFESNINAIAAAGITVGTGNGTYSPEADVTRAQMATFLARSLGIGS